MSINTEEMLMALDECDNAFVSINICDDLTPQARAAVKKAWAKVQKVLMDSGYRGAGYSTAVKGTDSAYNLHYKKCGCLKKLTCTCELNILGKPHDKS